jgi:hypothetical protein
MQDQTVVVERFRCDDTSMDLGSSGATEMAIDQRAFGRHQLLAVAADRAGRAPGLVHCLMFEPAEEALTCCLDALDSDATAAAA